MRKTATDMGRSTETLLGSLLCELGFDLSHGFLAKVANEIGEDGCLSDESRDALTLREVGLVEACCETTFGGPMAQAA